MLTLLSILINTKPILRDGPEISSVPEDDSLNKIVGSKQSGRNTFSRLVAGDGQFRTNFCRTFCRKNCRHSTNSFDNYTNLSQELSSFDKIVDNYASPF